MDRVEGLTEWLILNRLDHGWRLFKGYNCNDGTQFWWLTDGKGPQGRTVNSKVVDILYLKEYIRPETYPDILSWKLTKKGQLAYLNF